MKRLQAWLQQRRKSAARATRSGAVSRSVTYATSPLLASKTPPWRSKFIVALVGIGSLVLVGRAVSIQIIHSQFYLDQGEKRYAHLQELQASRGRITDRHGALLATSIPVPSVWAIPKDVVATREQQRELARLLGLSPTDVAKKLGDRDSRFAWLKRQVDDATWQQVEKLGIKGIHASREYRRKYPEGEAAAHIVGFTDIDDRGQEGVELSFQDRLQGKDGSRVVVKDRLGRVVETVGDKVAPTDGRDLALTIDAKVQYFAYQHIKQAVIENKAKGGSVVVLDAQNGEVLALANYPSFNPSERRNVTGEQLRNRALTDIFEPGSTMKPFIASQSLDSGRVSPDTVLPTASFAVSGYPVTDIHPHKQLSVTQIVQKSSNVGAAKLAMQMPAQEIWALYDALGFGTKPELPFPGVASGKLRPAKAWKPVDQSRLAYGYGLSASLLQMARSYTVFSHDGEVIPVTMVRTGEAPAGVRVFKPETARSMRKMLQLAAGPEGTAPLAQTMGYTVGGKSGTAHKQREGIGGYEKDKYRSWFVGLSPIDAPRVIVAVMVDEPSAGKHYGGAVAAPVFSRVVAQTLRAQGVPPNLEVKPQIVAGPAAAQENF
jgi:cell division protein FtsI (penicillin-binding protein 3)